MDSITRGIRRYYHHNLESDVATSGPRLTTTFVVVLSVTYTLAYVLPFYLFSITRPTPSIHRSSPAVIQARIRLVTVTCIVCSLSTIYIITHDALKTRFEVFQLLGWYPIHLEDIFKSLFLTMILFAGPLFERVVVESGWRSYVTGRPLIDTLDSWTGWRNYVAGPISEEVMFRSLLSSLSLLTTAAPSQTIFITPLYFGVAHIHHLYETRITNPNESFIGIILGSLFQFAYTTIFGWYANFVLVRTGSLYSVILIHSFCNWMGFPRLWGRVEASVSFGSSPPPQTDPSRGPAYRAPFQQKPLNILWTVAYYGLLVTGLFVFQANLWMLTESKNHLATI